MQRMHGLNELRAQGRMTLDRSGARVGRRAGGHCEALSKMASKNVKRETTTSRRDLRPAGGVWQGSPPHGIRGVRNLSESALAGARPSCSSRSMASFRVRRTQQPRACPYEDDGGES